MSKYRHLAAAAGFAACAGALGWPQVGGAEALPVGTIIVRINGLDSEAGQMRCGLYTPGNWLKTRFQGTKVDIDESEVVCRFTDIPVGNYAVAIHHDENRDGRMNKFLGLPLENYGFSRNAVARLGPPSFDEARFWHGGSTTVQRATLQ